MLLCKKLPDKARIVYLFPDLKKCLMSLGQLCDAGMKITITSDHIILLDRKSNKQVLQGNREKNDGMWCLDLIHNPSVHKATVKPPVHKEN